MRIAALYDIHGNLPALEAVLGDVQGTGADLVVIGGDVLPGPMPREVLDRLLELDTPAQFIRGNGESAVLACLAGDDLGSLPEHAREPVRWTAEQLRPADEHLIASWPPTLRRGDVLFCHATPRSDTEIFTRQTQEERLAPIFGGLGVSLVVCGHTHMQFDRTVAGTRIVNAGSVGMPFGNPDACWLLLEPEVALRHTRYDRARAAAAVRATSYPQANDFAARNVLRPPTEHEMLGFYSKVELEG